MNLSRNSPIRARLIAAAIAMGALALLLARWQSTSSESHALLLTPPDEIASHAGLYRFALAQGRSAFSRQCAGCHGSRGQPDPLRGVPDLRDQDWLYGSGRVVEIEKVILYGIRAGNSKGLDLASMPAFATRVPYSRYSMPSLSPSELDDVARYLYSLRHPAADAEAAARGRKVFYGQSSGLCWDCHGAHGQGDAAVGAPNLNDTVWLFGDGSVSAIRTSIAYGRSGACPAWIGKLPFDTIRALAVYTQSLSRTK